MTLLVELKTQQLNARKAKNKLEATLLTTLLGEVVNVAKRNNSLISEELIQKTCVKFIKGAEIVIESSKPDSEARADAQAEISILENFLPKQLTDEELEVIIKNIITEFSSSGANYSMGQVMGTLKNRVGGQYDGKKASQLVKANISGL